MKTDIHPTYYPNAKVTCACGNAFTVGSTREKIEIEICSACHPFYTGEDKIIDTAGRVEKFKVRRQVAAEKQEKIREQKSEKVKAAAAHAKAAKRGKEKEAKEKKIEKKTPKKKTAE